jgi:hypothetical protein
MPIQRIPLSQPIETRDGLLNTDSRCVNGYFETRNGIREFVKRPGLVQHAVTPALPAAKGQGMVWFKNNLYVVVSDVLYKINPTTYASTVVGSLSGSGKTCYFTQTLNDGYLFIQDQVNGYLVNGSTGAFNQITNDKVATVTIITGGTNYASGDTVTFSAPPSGVTATGTIQLTGGVITDITITNPGSGYVTAPSITINTSTGSGFSGNALLNFFPTGGLVPGAVFLDSYIAVGTPGGRIYTSNVGDPTIWSPLDYITAEAEPDNSVGIAKHLNYILDFGQWSTEFFYDAGNAIASPLASAPSYRLEIGCANGDSIASFEQSVFWVGTSKTVGPSVFGVDGTAPIKLSTVYIDRILQNSTLQDITSYGFKINGHVFYVLTLHDVNVTIVYDVGEKMWYQWTMWAVGTVGSGVPGIYGEQYFRPSYYAGYGSTYYLLDDDNGKLYTILDHYYNDAGAPIYYRAVTDVIDNGTTKRKFYNRVEIVGDKVAATMQIRHSDNDYESYSPYRPVDLNLIRPQTYQNGAARRRSWEFLCTDNAPLRLDSAEIDFDIGELENEGGAAPTQYRR